MSTFRCNDMRKFISFWDKPDLHMIHREGKKNDFQVLRSAKSAPLLSKYKS